MESASNWITSCLLLMSVFGHRSHSLNVDRGNDTARKRVAQQCMGVCKKIESDCYFDCGRKTNIKSMILERLWVSCTDGCDRMFLNCKSRVLSHDGNLEAKGCLTF